MYVTLDGVVLGTGGLMHKVVRNRLKTLKLLRSLTRHTDLPPLPVCGRFPPNPTVLNSGFVRQNTILNSGSLILNYGFILAFLLG